MSPELDRLGDNGDVYRRWQERACCATAAGAK